MVVQSTQSGVQWAEPVGRKCRKFKLGKLKQEGFDIVRLYISPHSHKPLGSSSSVS